MLPKEQTSAVECMAAEHHGMLDQNVLKQWDGRVHLMRERSQHKVFVGEEVWLASLCCRHAVRSASKVPCVSELSTVHTASSMSGCAKRQQQHNHSSLSAIAECSLRVGTTLIIASVKCYAFAHSPFSDMATCSRREYNCSRWQCGVQLTNSTF